MRGIIFSDRESESGKMLNAYLQNRDYKFSDEAIHLLFAVNRWEMKEQIMKDLQAGITLVCDRYAFSGVAYSAAKVRTHSFKCNRGHWINMNLRLGPWLWMVQSSRPRPGEARSHFLYWRQCWDHIESRKLRRGTLWEGGVLEESRWGIWQVQGISNKWRALGDCKRWWEDNRWHFPRSTRTLCALFHWWDVPLRSWFHG